eukprot:EG_transcript_11276
MSRSKASKRSTTDLTGGLARPLWSSDGKRRRQNYADLLPLLAPLPQPKEECRPPTRENKGKQGDGLSETTFQVGREGSCKVYIWSLSEHRFTSALPSSHKLFL